MYVLQLHLSVPTYIYVYVKGKLLKSPGPPPHMHHSHSHLSFSCGEGINPRHGMEIVNCTLHSTPAGVLNYSENLAGERP
jgi:hypothetical protein